MSSRVVGVECVLEEDERGGEGEGRRRGLQVKSCLRAVEGSRGVWDGERRKQVMIEGQEEARKREGCEEPQFFRACVRALVGGTGGGIHRYENRQLGSK